MGREEIITLTRCAYLGSQKYGSLVWSGDIPSTFESLSHQVKADLHEFIALVRSGADVEKCFL